MSSQKIQDNLARIEADGKKYESLALKYDPHYQRSIEAIPLIEKFIRDNDLIIYGGTAIDYALRLHGDAIYPDEALDIPDLDFFSPDSVNHSYEMANILYKAGYTAARAIVATHVQTMRVDIGDNHFLADISYVPPEIFKTLPTIDYKGFRVIHPLFQKIDLHSSLTFPFDNPPREVIFARWRKDIKRFNLLHKYYPTPINNKDNAVPVLIEATLPHAAKSIPLNGFAAYAVVRQALEELLGVPLKDSDYMPARITAREEIRFQTLDGIDLVHHNVDEVAKILGVDSVKTTAPYFNLVPTTLTGKINNTNVCIQSSHDQYLTVHHVEIDETQLTIVSVQYLLKYFLTCAQLHPDDSAIYYRYYESLIKMIAAAEKRFIEYSHRTITTIDFNNLLMSSPFFPSVRVFGSENRSHAYKIQRARAIMDMGRGNTLPKLPANFYPHRGNKAADFDFESNAAFTMDGRVLK